jgi:carboxyvinyl-carboxyphosphonate phosphorylmutase
MSSLPALGGDFPDVVSFDDDMSTVAKQQELFVATPSQHDLRNEFRQRLAGDECYYTASVFDPMSARIAADLGFEVGILGGSVASLQVLAAPDFALITLSEFVEQATRIGRVARLPVIADADHGYGNALNVMRTITELERAGVAALTIEDTLLPAQYGHKSTDLIPVEEGVGKMRAALEARIDPAMSIIARTHAGQLDDDAAIARIRAYQAAGVDAICLVGVRDFEHLEKLAAPLTVPLMLVTYDNPALRDRERLARLGVRIVVNGHAAYFAAIKATYDCLREQRDIATNDLDASQLSTRYSTLDEYRIWAREYMDVKE